MAFKIDKNPISALLVLLLVVSLRRCFLFSFSKILSSFLVVADLHEVVDSRFSAQGARVRVVRDGSTNLSFQHRAFCNSRTAMTDFC